MNQRLKFIAFVLASVFYSCGTSDTKLEGHWHLSSPDGIPFYYSTVDFNDTMGVVDKYKSIYFECEVTNDKKGSYATLLNGHAEEYKFVMENDRLLLLDDELDSIAIGTRPEVSSCTFETHCLDHKKLDIDLPVLELSKTSEPPNKAYMVKFYIGQPKSIARNKYGPETKIQTWNGIISLDDIEITNDKHDSKIYLIGRSTVSVALFVDKNTDTDYLKSVLKEQAKVVGRVVYIVGKPSADVEYEKDLVFMEVDVNTTFDSNVSIEEWLEKDEIVLVE